MIKEWFNSVKKELVMFAFGFAVAFAVMFIYSDRRIDRANSEIATLRVQLSDARTEVQRAGVEVRRARQTLTEIRKVQSDITTGLGQSNSELHTIIEGLQVIRDKVQDIESLLDSYYANNNSD